MVKKISLLFMTLCLTLSALAYGEGLEENKIILEYKEDMIRIKNNNNVIQISEGRPLIFFMNNEERKYPGDSSKTIDKYEFNILDGHVSLRHNIKTITDGTLLIETNLGDVLLDKDGIYLNDMETYRVDTGFDTKPEYKSKFDIKQDNTDKTPELISGINGKLLNLETEILKLSKIINNKSKEDQESRTLEKENLDTRIKTLEDRLVKEISKNKPVVRPVTPTTTTTTTSNAQTNTQKSNISKAKGNLEIKIDLPKSLEDKKQDIFVEIDKPSSSGDYDLFYLSPKNQFKNSMQLEKGDYKVKSIYFLDQSLNDLYKFEHNDIMKVLENQTTYLNIVATEDGIDIEEELLEEDLVKNSKEVFADGLSGEEPTKEKSTSKRSFIYFVIIISALLGVLIWKFNLINKIIYKE